MDFSHARCTGETSIAECLEAQQVSLDWNCSYMKNMCIFSSIYRLCVYSVPGVCTMYLCVGLASDYISQHCVCT